MKKTILILVLAFILAHSMSDTAVAQRNAPQPAGSWDAVRDVPRGEQLELRIFGGRKIKGTLNEATETTLTLLSGDKMLEFYREEVARVSWLFTKTSARSIIDAASKGVEVADETGAILNPGQSGGTMKVMLPGAPADGITLRSGGTAEGKAIGAGVGAIVGLAKKGRRSVLIYAR